MPGSPAPTIRTRSWSSPRERIQRTAPSITSRPSQIASAQKNEPGTEKCIAIVYQGENAVQKIREVLGPTDPSKAPPGSIRKEFGQTIMINAAHASDSVENARREMNIVQVDENNFKPLIENFYRRK